MSALYHGDDMNEHNRSLCTQFLGLKVVTDKDKKSLCQEFVTDSNTAYKGGHHCVPDASVCGKGTVMGKDQKCVPRRQKRGGE
tara:strand:+ start:1436 stop:1684 length:249 start_codon:yes stop_codon:yes gene_type:complete